MNIRISTKRINTKRFCIWNDSGNNLLTRLSTLLAIWDLFQEFSFLNTI
ncbi:hypothetical protein LEP1GSC192_2943 [Leptospira sp. B5-022]|nr:hypothetical protein LEP1GSC192_2943 [Leptospira sp. B5-022]